MTGLESDQSLNSQMHTEGFLNVFQIHTQIFIGVYIRNRNLWIYDAFTNCFLHLCVDIWHTPGKRMTQSEVGQWMKKVNKVMSPVWKHVESHLTFPCAGERGRWLFCWRLLRAGGRWRQRRLATATAGLATENWRLATPTALDGLGGAVLPWLLLFNVCGEAQEDVKIRPYRRTVRKEGQDTKEQAKIWTDAEPVPLEFWH